MCGSLRRVVQTFQRGRSCLQAPNGNSLQVVYPRQTCLEGIPKFVAHSLFCFCVVNAKPLELESLLKSPSCSDAWKTLGPSTHSRPLTPLGGLLWIKQDCGSQTVPDCEVFLTPH